LVARDRRNSRYDHYNIDRLEAKIFTAMLANDKVVYVSKRLLKPAKQIIAIQNLDLKIKTY
jgi:hypothetical protein